MSPLTLPKLTAVIDNGQPLPCSLHVDHERVDVSTDLPVSRHDPAWESVDAAGHWHGFAKDGKLPTLTRRENHECVCDDGACGWAMEDHCVICDEVIEPHWIQDWSKAGEQASITARRSATVTVDGRVGEDRQLVSVRVFAGDAEMFGVGEIDQDFRETVIRMRSLERRAG